MWRTSACCFQNTIYFLVIVLLCLFCSQGLADNTVIAKVNKVVWDLDRPLEEDCSLELLKFEDEEAQAVSIFHQIFFFVSGLHLIQPLAVT